MPGASPHRRRQTPSTPPPFLAGFQLETTMDFPRLQQVYQEVLTHPQHSGESSETYQCPPRDAIC